MKLFEYAVIHHPKKKEKGEEKTSTVIVPVTTVLAETEQEVTMLAARQIPQGFSKRLGECEVAVRPF